jgi:hypothetical protein
MKIDIARETPIRFAEAPKHIPGRPAIQTLHRWRLHGVRGRQLETFLSGGRRFTTVEAIHRFLSPDDAGDSRRNPTRAPSLTYRATAAERELQDRHGI